MFGCRMAVGQFFELVKNHVVRNWSTDRDPSNINAKLYETQPNYSLEDYTKAYQWLQAKKPAQIKKINRDLKFHFLLAG